MSKDEEIAMLRTKLVEARNGLFSVHRMLGDMKTHKDREAVVRATINARMAASIALHLSTP